MRESKRFRNPVGFILLCFGWTLLIFSLTPLESFGAPATIDQEIQQKRKELNEATAEADKIRTEVRNSHPSDNRPTQNIIQSDIATLQKRLEDLKDAKLVVLTVVVLDIKLQPEELQRANKKLSPFLRLDENGNFHLGPALSWAVIFGAPAAISSKEVKIKLDDWIHQIENEIRKLKDKLIILAEESSLKAELAQLEKRKGRGNIVRFVLNCAKNEIYEDETTMCSTKAFFEDGSMQILYEGVKWDPSNCIDKNGTLRGVEVKKQAGNLPQEITVKVDYDAKLEEGGKSWTGFDRVKVLPRPTSAAIQPPQQTQPQQPKPQLQQMASVPDVIGLEKGSAGIVITTSNLKVGNIRTQKDAQRAGVVIDQDPRPGSRAQVGSAVHLVVSSGTPSAIRTLYVDPAYGTVEMNGKLRLRALLWYTDGREEDVTMSAAWTGADRGEFTAKSSGKFQVTASFSGFSSSATITVPEPPPPAWSPPISRYDDRNPQYTEPPPDAYKWYVFCSPDKGEVTSGSDTTPQALSGLRVMAGPFPGPRNARFWIEQNCPTWRCDTSGACAMSPARGGKWKVLCGRKDFRVYLGETYDSTRYWLLQDGFLGEPDARRWANGRYPNWNCSEGGIPVTSSPASGPQMGGRWTVVCSKQHGGVGLTEYPDSMHNWIWREGFLGEPDARRWVDQSCPSWRCDRDGNCMPGSGLGGRPLELPPDFSDIAERFRSREERRNDEMRERTIQDSSRHREGDTLVLEEPVTGETSTSSAGDETSPTSRGWGRSGSRGTGHSQTDSSKTGSSRSGTSRSDISRPGTTTTFKCKANSDCWTHYSSDQYYCNKGNGKCVKCPPGQHGKKDGTAACCDD